MSVVLLYNRLNIDCTMPCFGILVWYRNFSYIDLPFVLARFRGRNRWFYAQRRFLGIFLVDQLFGHCPYLRSEIFLEVRLISFEVNEMLRTLAIETVCNFVFEN